MSHRAAAFTLIEALIAVALGAVVTTVAFAGFRTAAQTTATADRLATENALLRAGVRAAHDEIDFWRSYDDPDDAANRKLRATGPSGGGLPFTPFSATWPTAAGADREGDRGYVGAADAWAPHDPRTWFAGSLSEKDHCILLYGRYGMLASAADNPTHRDNAPQYAEDVEAPAVETVGYRGAPPPARHWYYRQMQGLMNALGFYGFCDYLPANAIYEVCDDPALGSCNRDGVPYFWVTAGSQFCNNDLACRSARGKYRNTNKCSYAIIDPRAVPAAALDGDHRRRWQVGYLFGGEATDFPDFSARTDVPTALTPGGQPAHWPRASVSVGRFYKNCRPVTMCRVRATSPITGQRVELSFAGWGTTLRGARQQRRPNGGWARWDDAPTAANDATLDD